MDPQPVVPHPDQPDAPLLQFNLNLGRTGIEAVLHQFLDHRGRPFHHFTGGDLIYEMRG